jgi:hypothetical protein
MSDEESILPPSVGELELIQDFSLDDDDDVGVAADAPRLPIAGPKSSFSLSPWLAGCELLLKKPFKEIKQRITSIKAVNPRVHRFAQGETPMALLKVQNKGVNTKKYRSRYADNRYAMLLVAYLDNGGHLFGYAFDGKNGEFVSKAPDHIDCFRLLPSTHLAAFHPPTFNFKEYLHDTSYTPRTEVCVAPAFNNAEFAFPVYDTRIVIDRFRRELKARNGEKDDDDSDAEEKKTPKKKKKSSPKRPAKKVPVDDTTEEDESYTLVTRSNQVLLKLQAVPDLSGVAVFLEQSPHFQTIKRVLGPERFPVMLSETVEGARSLPYGFGLDLRSAVAIIKRLVGAGGIETSPTGVWETDTIMRAIMILNLGRQFYTMPCVRFLLEQKIALSEKNLATFLDQFITDDRGNRYAADAVLQLCFAKWIVDGLLSERHPILHTAGPLIAFASAAHKICSIKVENLRPDGDRPTTLRCALTDTEIVPGQQFHIVHAKSRPTETSQGQEMVATIAASIFDAQMSLTRTLVWVPPPPLSLSSPSVSPPPSLFYAEDGDDTQAGSQAGEARGSGVRERREARGGCRRVQSHS